MRDSEIPGSFHNLQEPAAPKGDTVISQEQYLYDERFHGLKLAIDFIVLGLVELGLVIVGAWCVWLLQAAPRLKPVLDNVSGGEEYWPFWIIVVILTVAVGIYIWPRTYWLWKHTRLKASLDGVTLERKASVVWLSSAVLQTVKTSKIDSVNLGQSLILVILRKLLGWNVWGVTLDTPATTDAAFHDLRFVVDGPRIMNIVISGKKS
jgi:hypothetical protein